MNAEQFQNYQKLRASISNGRFTLDCRLPNIWVYEKIAVVYADDFKVITFANSWPDIVDDNTADYNVIIDCRGEHTYVQVDDIGLINMMLTLDDPDVRVIYTGKFPRSIILDIWDHGVPDFVFRRGDDVLIVDKYRSTWHSQEREIEFGQWAESVIAYSSEYYVVVNYNEAFILDCAQNTISSKPNTEGIGKFAKMTYDEVKSYFKLVDGREK